MKEFDIYNTLTKEQKMYLGSLSLINDFENANDPATNFGKSYGASQENKETIFSKAQEAWLKSDELGIDTVADNFVDAFNRGLTMEKLNEMDKWDLVDLGSGIVPDNYEENEEESKEIAKMFGIDDFEEGRKTSAENSEGEER